MIGNAHPDPAQPVERFYHDLILAAPDAMLAVEAGAGYLFLANAAAAALLGYDSGELARLGPDDILDPADLARLPAIWRQLDETGTWRGEWRLRHQVGATIVAEASVSRLLLGGRVIYQVVLRDLHAWNETTQHLLRCETQLVEAQQLARLGIWEWDAVEDRVTWSIELYRIFGVRPEDGPLTYQGVLERVHPTDRAHLEETVAAARRAAGSYVCEHRIIRPNGEVRCLQSRGTVVLDAAGQTVRMHGTGQDITERRQAEEALRQRERELRALLEQAPDLILRFDRDLRLVYVNPAVERAIGQPAGDLLGKTTEEAGLAPGRLPAWPLTLQQVFRLGHEQMLEVPVPGDGAERQYQVRLTPVFGQDGSVESVLCVARDISERRRADEEREQLFRELLEREARLRDMVEQILLGQASQRRREQGSSRLESLSPQEREILRLLAAGSTNQQIGRTLGLSTGTVRNKVSRLLPKLDAVDRTQAAARAVEWGLLD
jgi:PAS domain S-box-containing protein